MIGATIAWVFSYVMPSWERNSIPALVSRALAAQARHARVALGLAHLQAVDNEPELAWRLARREAYDSLSALVQATQRAVSEPRAVHPPLEPLERLLARSSQLLAQLTAVKSMLLQRRGQLNTSRMRAPLLQAADAIESALLAAPDAAARTPTAASRDPVAMPPVGSDEGLDLPVLRRLAMLQALAAQLRSEADEVAQALAGSAAAGSPEPAAPRRARSRSPS